MSSPSHIITQYFVVHLVILLCTSHQGVDISRSENFLARVFESLTLENGIIEAREIYEDMINQFQEAFIRFHVVMEQTFPSFPTLLTLCPLAFSTCSSCPLPPLLCRLCCPPPSPRIARILPPTLRTPRRILPPLLDITWWGGLWNNLQAWLQPRQQLSETPLPQIRELINNFHSKDNEETSWTYVKPQENQANVEETEQAQYSLEDEEPLLSRRVCGYYSQEQDRDMKIMGGEEVGARGRFPWQLSLATGLLGTFFQHRLGG